MKFKKIVLMDLSEGSSGDTDVEDRLWTVGEEEGGTN